MSPGVIGRPASPALRLLARVALQAPGSTGRYPEDAFGRPDEEQPYDQAKGRGNGADTDIELLSLAGRHKPGRRCEGDDRIGDQQPDDERREGDDTCQIARSTDDRRDDQDLGSVAAPMPWISSMPYAVR